MALKNIVNRNRGKKYFFFRQLDKGQAGKVFLKKTRLCFKIQLLLSKILQGKMKIKKILLLVLVCLVIGCLVSIMELIRLSLFFSVLLNSVLAMFLHGLS
jgi:predicted neutral ceramidase superfamily lipid hydrolase